MCRKSHLEFKPLAFEDLQFRVRTNPKLPKRLLRLIEEAVRDPFGGVGKPEPLRGELSGWWSKRIDQDHRLVYQVEGERLIVAQARGYYDDCARKKSAAISPTLHRAFTEGRHHLHR